MCLMKAKFEFMAEHIQYVKKPTSETAESLRYHKNLLINMWAYLYILVFVSGRDSKSALGLCRCWIVIGFSKDFSSFFYIRDDYFSVEFL